MYDIVCVCVFVRLSGLPFIFNAKRSPCWGLQKVPVATEIGLVCFVAYVFLRVCFEGNQPLPSHLMLFVAYVCMLKNIIVTNSY